MLLMCQNTTMQIYGTWNKRYRVLCSKTYNTSLSVITSRWFATSHQVCPHLWNESIATPIGRHWWGWGWGPSWGWKSGWALSRLIQHARHARPRGMSHMREWEERTVEVYADCGDSPMCRHLCCEDTVGEEGHLDGFWDCASCIPDGPAI